MFYLRLFSKQAGNQGSNQAYFSILRAVGGDHESLKKDSVPQLSSVYWPQDRGSPKVVHLKKRA